MHSSWKSRGVGVLGALANFFLGSLEKRVNKSAKSANIRDPIGFYYNPPIFSTYNPPKPGVVNAEIFFSK
jgi:hypothetical protein